MLHAEDKNFLLVPLLWGEMEAIERKPTKEWTFVGERAGAEKRGRPPALQRPVLGWKSRLGGAPQLGVHRVLQKICMINIGREENRGLIRI